MWASPKTNIQLLVLIALLRFSTYDAFTTTTITFNVGRTYSSLGQLSHKVHRQEHAAEDCSSVSTLATSYQTSFHHNTTRSQKLLQRWFNKLSNNGKKKHSRGRSNKVYQFSYDYNKLTMNNELESNDTTGVILIHPIGVGISKWYYDRLLYSLNNQNKTDQRLVFLAPDLIGSGSASAPYEVDGGERLTTFPLLNVTDWSNQMEVFMAEYESSSKAKINNWVVVANGGCAPIALRVARSSVTTTVPFKAPVTNVVLSSPPRLPFFLESTDPAKVHKAYKTLSGVTGKVFWWYALRRQGRFIQTFSERNLVGDPKSLGERWTPNCLAAAKLHNGQSKYSTFAFLAGALQDGCVGSLNSLRGSNVKVDFIRGRDIRRNRAKSWFWKRKKKSTETARNNSDAMQHEDARKTIQQYMTENGNRGNELFVDGRISLAWEDADGYAKSLIELLSEK